MYTFPLKIKIKIQKKKMLYKTIETKNKCYSSIDIEEIYVEKTFL